MADARRRTVRRLMNLLISDGYIAYKTAIRQVYGETVEPALTGEPGRPRRAIPAIPEGLTYAVVEKTLKTGRVMYAKRRVVFGTWTAVVLALGMSGVSRVINTGFHRTGERNGPASELT